MPADHPRAQARAMVDPSGTVRTQAYYRNEVAKAAGWSSQQEYRQATKRGDYRVAMREHRAHVNPKAVASPSSPAAQATLAKLRGIPSREFWQEIRRERRRQGLPPDIES